MRAVSVGRTEIDWEMGMSFRGFASVVVSVIMVGALLQLSNSRRMEVCLKCLQEVEMDLATGARPS